MRPRVIVSVSNFFFSFFLASTFYVFLPYLTSYMSAAAAGLVVAFGALVACAIFPFLPWLVARYGVQQLSVAIGIVEMLVLLGLAANPGPVFGSLFIAFTGAVQPFLAYLLDLMLEATVKDEGTTGRVRNMFLTVGNVAILGAPLALGALLASSDAYGRVFLAGAASLVPFVVLLAARTLPTENPPRLARIRDVIACMARDRDLAAVTFGNLLLYLFYAWAPLYFPLYLHTVLGIPWSTLGWVFSVMLLPFLIIEYPAGWLADLVWGDKELMVAGFLIAGSALAAMAFVSTATPLLILVGVLVISRIGAALIESMVEGHFFRRVSEQDVATISVFRGIWPLANLLAPAAGSLILYFDSYALLFIATGGFIIVAGVISTLFIRDFR